MQTELDKIKETLGKKGIGFGYLDGKRAISDYRVYGKPLRTASFIPEKTHIFRVPTIGWHDEHIQDYQLSFDPKERLVTMDISQSLDHFRCTLTKYKPYELILGPHKATVKSVELYDWRESMEIEPIWSDKRSEGEFRDTISHFIEKELSFEEFDKLCQIKPRQIMSQLEELIGFRHLGEVKVI